MPDKIKNIKIELAGETKKEVLIHGLKPDPWRMSISELMARVKDANELIRTHQEDANLHLRLEDAAWNKSGDTDKWNYDIAKAVMSDTQLMKVLGFNPEK